MATDPTDRSPMAAESPAASWRPKLRTDLRCSLQEYDGTPCYVVEDPARSRFFRLGIREWTLVSFLDGKNSLADAVELSGASLGAQSLTPAEALRLARWLVGAQLTVADSPTGAERGEAPGEIPSAGRGTVVSPFYIRLPLVNPDRFLSRLMPWTGWAFGVQCLTLVMSLSVAGLYQVLGDWHRFSASAAELLSPAQWPLLVAVWMLLKVLHELAHGVACKHYGAPVPSAGLVLILFSPVAYIDVTAAWRIRSRWHRVIVSAFGMYAEVAVAGAAAIVWGATSAGWINHLSHNVVLAAGVSTILFNVNPLMRFDGYYILADLTGATNLYGRGQAYVRYLGRRWLLALPEPLPADARRLWIRVYGVASFAWRITVCASLTLASMALLGGLGIILTALGAFAWIVLPAVRLGRLLLRGDAMGRPDLRRAGLRLAMAAGTAGVLLAMPWPVHPSAPAVVEYAPLVHVRADIGGFVHRVCVESGQRVAAGQVLAELTNDDASVELQTLRLEIEQSRIKSRIYYQDNDLSKYQIELRSEQSLEAKRRQLAARVESLVLRAPRAGRVLARNLAALEGTFLAAGGELLALGSEEQKELELSVSQEDLERFRDSRPAAYVRIRGGQTLRVDSGALAVLPRANGQLPHAALGAHCGGPLAVRPAAPPAETSPGSAPPIPYELLQPRFNARIPLPAPQAAQLHAGQLATVRLGTSGETVAGHLYRAISSWAAHKTAA